MNNKHDDMSFLNLEGYLVAVILWIVALVGTGNELTVIVLIACIVVLALEKKSELLKNHASQLLGLSIIAVIFGIIMKGIVILLTTVFFLVPVVGSPFVLLVNLVSSIFNLAYVVYAALGLYKAFKKEEIRLPIIYPFGHALENVFKNR